MIFDSLKNIRNYAGLGRVYEALQFAANTDFSQMECGKYALDGDTVYYMVQEYETHAAKDPEAHRKYIDIQLVLEGEECIGVAPLEDQLSNVEKPEKDVWFYPVPTQMLKLRKGDFMVLYPNDLHAPGVQVDAPAPCRKLVMKVLV